MPRPRPERPVTRRVVLGAGVTLLLGGCGIRLEEDAPRVPLVPTRDPVAGEDALVALLQQTRQLRAMLTDPYADGLARQAAVLDSALRERGVPATELDPTEPTGSSSSGVSTNPTDSPSRPVDPSRSTTSSRPGTSSMPATPGRPATSAASGTGSAPSGTRSAVADSASAALDLLEVVEPALRPAVASLSVSRVLLAQELGGRVAGAPAPSDLPAPQALALLAACRQAAYGLEVATARSTDKQRTAAMASLERVRGWVTRLEDDLGDAAPPTPTAYELPLQVSDDRTAKRLIRHLTGGLVQACGALLTPAGVTPDGARSAAGWLLATARLERAWGADWVPFPGLA